MQVDISNQISAYADMFATILSKYGSYAELQPKKFGIRRISGVYAE